ncbi:MAG: hypothetical protein KatS3mg015_1971 [Fimbriimonadales bacterium]|nr:MAG: hypothetical protein KatS3mg015_1971 [Fimbriimonadales bacterium]
MSAKCTFFRNPTVFAVVVLIGVLFACGVKSTERGEPRKPQAATQGGVRDADRDALETETMAPTTEELQRLVEMYPESAHSHYLLGRRLRSDGQVEQAIGVLQRAIQLDPVYFEAYFELAWCYYDLRMRAQQLHVYEQLLKQGSGLPRDVRAMAHMYAGNVLTVLAINGDGAAGNTAIMHFEQSRLLNPSATGPLLGKGRALMALGRWDEAIRVFRSVVEEADGPIARASALEGIANAYWYGKNDKDTAERYLEAARSEVPQREWRIQPFLAPSELGRQDSGQ